MKTICLLLTCSTTVFSRCIRFLTSAPFTHVAISVSGDPADCFYSFGRKIPQLPFPAGFVRESTAGGFLHRFPRTKCTLLAMEISDASHAAICSRLRKMETCSRYYRYNVLGALLCGMGIRWERRRRYFCSQFIGDLLEKSGAVSLPKPAALMQPIDYAFLPGVRVLFTGQAGEMFSLPQVKTALAG